MMDDLDLVDSAFVVTVLSSRNRLWVTERTVEKHIHSILAKLPLPETDDDHRRVLAVIALHPG